MFLFRNLAASFSRPSHPATDRADPEVSSTGALNVTNRYRPVWQGSYNFNVTLTYKAVLTVFKKLDLTYSLALFIEVCRCSVKVVFTWKFIMRVVNRLHSQALSGKYF